MLTKILIFCFTTLFFALPSVTSYDVTLKEFVTDEKSIVNEYVQSQLNRVKDIIETSFTGKDKDERNRDDQTNKMTRDISSYIENLKASGKTITNLWASFLPTDDINSRLRNPDVELSVPGIIARNGYICETHTIVSQGYILNVHRIPRSKNGRTIPKNTVLLQHGLFDSSFNWIINGPHKSLAYVLADAGFDVWMTNTRGNVHVREHVTYKTNTKEFWNFSFHENALYDMPLVIDYIQKVRGENTKIAYIGHSMGTTILFSMLSLKPEYNDKLSVGIALAPGVFLSNMKSPTKLFSGYEKSIVDAAEWFHSYEVVHRDFIDTMSRNCQNEFANSICNNVAFYIFGEDEEQLNKTILANYLMKGSSTSWKTVLHLFQLINTGKFQQFDYGDADSNWKVYGADNPPEYDLSNVKLNITIFWSKNDLLSDEEDVKKLHNTLPNNTKMYLVPFPKFNHVDYQWAKDAPRLVNDKVMEILRETFKFESKNV